MGKAQMVPHIWMRMARCGQLLHSFPAVTSSLDSHPQASSSTVGPCASAPPPSPHLLGLDRLSWEPEDRDCPTLAPMGTFPSAAPAPFLG